MGRAGGLGVVLVDEWDVLRRRRSGVLEVDGEDKRRGATGAAERAGS
jgi:hypothetical protein